MKILLLTPRPNVQGPIPRVTPLLVAALKDLGCQVATAPWGRRHDRESLFDRVGGRAVDVARIRRALARQMPDVMVVNTSHDWRALSRDIPLLLATRQRCPRIALQFHGSLSDRLEAPGNRLFKLASAWLLRLADAALVLSREEQQQWQRFYPQGDFRVVDNPHLPADERPLTCGRSAWGLPTDRPLLLFVARLIAEKGIYDLLQAMPRVLAQMPCHLLVAGSGQEEGRIRHRVAELGLTDHVTLAGYLDEEQLYTAYRLADVFVLPTFWSEGFPRAIIEAMDARLPIVTTPLRGMADHLRHGENAFFVPPRDPAALAETLLYTLARPLLWTTMGEANHEKVKGYAPQAVAPRYLEMLKEIVARP